jgi:hypothetical protein
VVQKFQVHWNAPNGNNLVERDQPTYYKSC